MSVICNKLKFVPTIVGNFLPVNRGYAVVKKIPITWIRPEKISCVLPEKSGDGGLDFKIKPEDPLLHYEKSEEYQTADEFIKRLFSVDFNSRKEYVTLQKKKAMELVQRHSHDVGSIEAKIAHATAEILQLQEHHQKNRKDSKTKVFLKELIEERKKLLKKLRVHDYARFEFLLERLNLVYHPFPEENPRLFVKDCTKRLLRKHCDEMVQKKLDNYRKELESQQKDFYKEKAEKLEFIRSQEIKCGVTPSITEEEVEAAKQKAASFA